MRGLGDPRQPAPFAVVVLLGFVVAKFLSVAAHEVLGHGLSTEVLGGSFYGVYVSPGSGFALVFLPLDSAPLAQAFVAMAGVLADVLFGVAVFAAYPRARTILGRLFLLLLLQVLLVYSFIYIALGALPGTGGDSAAAVVALDAPFLLPALFVVGLLWALGSAYLVSAELVRLVAPNAPLKRHFVFLALFWFTPLAAGFVPGLALATGSLLLYFALFLVVGGAVFGVAAFLASRMRTPAPPPTRMPEGRILPIAVALAVIVPVWIGVFGLSDADAHGILLQEPPLPAERTLFRSQAIDLQVDFATDRNVSLAFRMKGIESPGESPLEAQAFATFERRADFAFWAEESRALAAAATNVSAWAVMAAAIDGNGTVWFGGGTYGNPRLVVLGISDPADRPRLTSETVNGTRTYVAMTVYDPFRANRMPASCDTCFLDEVNLTWPGGPPEPFRFVDVRASGGTTVPLVGFDAASGRHYARYRNVAAADAPTTYTLLLEVL